MTTIPLVENNTQYDVCSRFYRKALLNTLIELKPKYCLEIGSHLLQSSQVFSYYFSKYMPEGHLITVDISEWGVVCDLPSVTRLMVYPHQTDINNRHGGLQVYYKDYERVLREKSNAASINIKIIHEKMDEFSIDQFQFCFCDADHNRVSFLADLLICRWLVGNKGFILVDDINDKNHDQYTVYREIKEKGNVFYEYDDWQISPGMGLIQCGSLKI